MLKFATLLLCVGATLAAVPLSGQQNFMQLWLESRAATEGDPALTFACFTYYMPILNDITDEYQKSYVACVKTGDDSRSQIDAKTQPQRDEIETNAINSCAALATCANETGSIPYFECFSSAGATNSKNMYNISADSNVALINVREDYRLIQTNQDRCTNASERVYVDKTASCNTELSACLRGDGFVPTTESTTVSTSKPTEGTTPESSTGSTAETTTTERTTEQTTPDDDETTARPTEPEENENVDIQKSRLLQDSKWRHIVGPLNAHFH